MSWAIAGCSGDSISVTSVTGSGGNAGVGGQGTTGGAANAGTSSNMGGSTVSAGGSSDVGGGAGNGGTSAAIGGNSASGGNLNTGGSQGPSGGTTAIGGSSAMAGGNQASGGSSANGGGASTSGGASTKSTGGSSVATGGAKATGGNSAATGGTQATGGSLAATGGSLAATGGSLAATGGSLAVTGGTKATGGTTAAGGNSDYPCDGTTTGYDATVVLNGNTWTVTRNGSTVSTTTDMYKAMNDGWNSLTSNRTSKQSVLVQGSGDIPASQRYTIPNYTILNVCGTINVTGSGSGDYAPIYARDRHDIDIPNLKMTGSPVYGMFFRNVDNIHLGQIDLRLASTAGIGIRIDSGSSASTMTTFNQNLTIDYVYGSGMGSHIVETYGVSNIDIGTVEGNSVGECGLLLNRSINAQVGLVTCTDCGTGTGYAAFRIANDAGKIGSDWPAGNIHVAKVYARGGGRGIFSVSGSGGLTIDQIDIANTGNNAILLQNCINTTIAEQSGTVSNGFVQLSNDTANTNSGKYAPSQNVAFKNLTLSNGATIRQDWCTEYGRNGCSATNITGGSVSMCP